MKTQKQPIKHYLLNKVGILIYVVIGMSLFTGSAWASTAANHVIRNTATVDYDDGSGNPQTAITASVDISVNLVESSPILSAPLDLSTDPATAAVYSYTLTATSNGPATYDLSAAVTGETQMPVGPSTAATSVATLTLGATTTAVGVTLNAAANTTITVPSDGADDGAVNGLAVGDTVEIGGFTYTIQSIDETDSADPDLTSTSTITIDFDGNTPALAVGAVIGEQGSFTTTVTPSGTPTTNPGTITVDTTATSQTTPAATATDTTVTTVSDIVLTVTKYVANITNPIVGGGSILTVDTGGGAGNISYYTTGVNGNPGDTLEYVIEVANAAVSSTASDVRITDPVPAFTTYTAGTIRLDPGTGTWAGALDGDADADAGEFGSNTVYIYVGSGGTDGAAGVGNGTGGSLAISTTTLGSFRVTIDN